MLFIKKNKQTNKQTKKKLPFNQSLDQRSLQITDTRHSVAIAENNMQ